MASSFPESIGFCADHQLQSPAGPERDFHPEEGIQVSPQYYHIARLLRGTFDIVPISPHGPQLFICLQTAHNIYLCLDLCTGGELYDRICAKVNYPERCVSRSSQLVANLPSIAGMPQISSGPSSTLLHAFTSLASSTVTSSQKTFCSGTVERMRTL